MDIKTLTELDYYRIRNTIAGFCLSPEGVEQLKNREPYTDVNRIDTLKDLGNEWRTYLQTSRLQALSSWPEISTLFPIMKTEGATLSQEQVFALAQFCSAVKRVTASITAAGREMNLKGLMSLVTSIPSLEKPDTEISRIINADGELRDLPELRTIRAAIAGYRRDIERLMHNYTSDSRLSSVLESNVPVFRANRQVLAVHASHRTAVKGIVQEVSQSGQTVYIEPEDIVRKNNDLVQEEFHLQQEIRRIFHDLTEKLRPDTHLFAEALPLMLELDTTCAAAKWGITANCVYALPVTDPENEAALILQARHPLLGDKAVPVDIPFMKGKRILIITGPNTGGKTVTLKTVALFALLNQGGFPVPAAEGTRLPVFGNFFADIGDDQSLDQSLSTFSGHMKNIAAALQQADKDSLVLLDELGSGTDPQEGGAIAMAVLDTLIERGATVLVTTHHGILKNYGYTHPACINASVDFNNDTLAPTYRLVMGVPGESHALDIAQRSGLPPEVTAEARAYLTNEQADVSSLIKGLTAKHAELDQLRQDFSRKQIEIDEIRRRTDQKVLEVRQRELELKHEGYREAQSFLADSRKKLENLVRTLKEGEVTHEKAVSVKQFIAAVTDSVSQQEQTLEQDDRDLARDLTARDRLLGTEKKSRGAAKNKKDGKRRLKNAEALAAASSTESLKKADITSVKPVLEPGAEVLAGTARRQGILLHRERKGLWSVQFGNIKMTVKERELTVLQAAGNSALQPSVTVDLAKNDERSDTVSSGIPGNRPVLELRLIGMRCEAALKLLERQLDLCTMQNLHEFSIIHGKGSGILQQAVGDYLSHYPGVEEFHFARPEDGGTGKTYVRMS